MRFIIKLAILALAGYGAQRLYSQLRPRVDELAGRTSTELQGAVETVKAAADDVTQDVKIAALQVHDDVAAPAQELKESAQHLTESATGSSGNS